MIWEWAKDHAWWIGIGSLLTFFGSLILLPVLVVRMAPDYFMPGGRAAFADSHPGLRIVGVIGKNVVGLLLFLAGVAMLFIPGQGLLTMLMGLALMDFPGKRAAEVWLVRKPKVNSALNWIRQRYGREPLQVP